MASMVNLAESYKQRWGFIYAPKPLSDILMQILAMPDNLVKLSKLDYYVNLFENELRKLDSFQRELHLCKNLLIEGLEMLKRERMKCMEKQEKGKWTMVSPQLSMTPIHCKKTLDNPETHDMGSNLLRWNREENGMSKERGAIGSIQLSPTPIRSMMIPVQAEEDLELRKRLRGPQKKKLRRCWSPELHRKFVEALQILGGTQCATPKQITALMKVEGLTNDEVKSHLQKYRLHIKKLPSSLAGTSGYPWLSQDEN